MAKGKRHSTSQGASPGRKAPRLMGAHRGVQGPGASSHKMKGSPSSHKQHTGKSGYHS